MSLASIPPHTAAALPGEAEHGSCSRDDERTQLRIAATTNPPCLPLPLLQGQVQRRHRVLGVPFPRAPTFNHFLASAFALTPATKTIQRSPRPAPVGHLEFLAHPLPDGNSCLFMTRMEALNNGPSSLVLISFFSDNGVSTIDLFRSLVFSPITLQLRTEPDWMSTPVSSPNSWWDSSKQSKIGMVISPSLLLRGLRLPTQFVHQRLRCDLHRDKPSPE